MNDMETLERKFGSEDGNEVTERDAGTQCQTISE